MQDVTFTNWAPGQPETPLTRQCTYILNTADVKGIWYTQTCDIKYKVVCQKGAGQL